MDSNWRFYINRFFYIKNMKKSSRSERAIVNTIAGFGQELVALICGLILPRMILIKFGSSYNGITSSITQFISCISLMKAGIGGVTRVALYKPLAENDYLGISAVVVQTQKFMRKIALCFVGFVIVFAAIYPIYISRDFDWIFSFSLILIIALSTFSQYYFGLTYQMVLNAAQHQSITLCYNMITTIMNTIISVFIIQAGGSIHVVKLGSAVVYVAGPIVLCNLVKKKYHIDTSVESKGDLIKQRWDAVGHEISNFVNNNTDIMVLTIFAGLKEVSVYTVYHYVTRSIRSVVTNFITGFGAAFGDMYVRDEHELMRKNLKIYELIVFSLASIVYSTTMIMIAPFAILYTKGVVDVEYYRPLFGVILVLGGAFSCYRIPYETVVKAVGHYKQTRNGAIAEAVINITVSIVLVIKFGLVGVAIGTLVAAIFRTIQYSYYLSKNIIKRSLLIFAGHVIVSLAIILVSYYLSGYYYETVIGMGEWIIKAVIATIISVSLTLLSDGIFYTKELKDLISILNKIIKKRMGFLLKK